MSSQTPGIWDKIDYAHDTVVEASAGTGKTFALQNIVLKLVQTKKVESATQILLVTFTEKAASELRDRVRDILQENNALPTDFDAMTIGTIHSFCKQLLTEHAFENGSPMQLEVTTAEMALLREAALAVIHSTDFAKYFGARFKEWAYVLDCTALDGGDKSLVTRIVKCVKELAGTQEKAQDWSVLTATPPSATVSSIFQDAVAAWQKLSSSNPMPPNDDQICAWIQRLSNYTKGPIHGGDVSSVTKHYRSVQELMDALIAKRLDDVWKGFVTCRAHRETKKDNPSYYLNPRFNKRPKEAGRLCDIETVDPALKDFVEKTQSAFAEAIIQLGILQAIILVSLAHAVRTKYEERKSAAGVMTFDDMVLRAEAALQGPNATPLIEAVRRRWRYALVDEFQDTDRHQWNIFHKLFSHAERPKKDPGALLVVGDPKQAIYSFRGADISVYLEARKTMAKGAHAALLSLDTTYRCTERLTEVFNCLFSLPQWFEPPTPAQPGSVPSQTAAQPGTIAYAPVKWGRKHASHKDFAPLVLLESLPTFCTPPSDHSKGLGDPNRCLPMFARNAAAEIKRLRGRTVETGEGVTRRELDYGDFCFLVRRRDHAAYIKRALAKAGIPYSHYKEAGLYDSAEGESALAVFDFLADRGRPGNLQALLLTPFFGVAPKDLAAWTNDPGQVFWDLVDVWQTLAAARDWAGLFASLLHASRAARRQGNDPEFDRRLAALRQIFDDLLFRPEHPPLEVADLSAMLRAWAAEERGAAEAGTREKESDAEHVQIMTMHAAKGLEFPVVFVAAGFTPMKTDDAPEEKRLFYVALTRAQFRLYLPWTDNGDELGIGQKDSPLRIPATAEDDEGPGFLGQAIKQWREQWRKKYPKAQETTEVVSAETPHDWAFKGTDTEPTEPTEPAKNEEGAAPAAPASEEGTKPGDRADRLNKINDGAFRANSYSSLHGALARAGKTIGDLTGDGTNDEAAPTAPEAAATNDPDNAPQLAGRREQDESDDLDAGLAESGGDESLDDNAAPGAAARKTLLPRGALSGDVFHKIMERLCRNPDDDPARPGFANAADKTNKEAQKGLLALVKETRGWFGLENREEGVNSTDQTLADMARRALNAPLHAGDGTTFRLCAVPRADRRAEVRFVAGEGLVAAKEECPEGEGAFNGSIDLAFQHNGKYYLIDWKTNTLAAYDETAMRDVYDKEYSLQGQIYGAVLNQWLGRAPAKVIYMFVRAWETDAPKGNEGILMMDAEKAEKDDNAGRVIAAALKLRAKEKAQWLKATAARRRHQQDPGAFAKEKDNA